MLLRDGKWLHDYFQRRCQAIRANADPIDAFVPVADAAALEEAWIIDAPKPAIAHFLSPGDSLEVQAILQSMSWRITAPLRALATALRSFRVFISSRTKNAVRNLRVPWIPSKTASRSSERHSSHGLLARPSGEFRN
jgi:hypothetical protein